MHKYLLLLIFIVLFSGCSSNRIEKDGSLTIKLKDGFAKHYSTGEITVSSPVNFEYLEWEYEPNQEKRNERDRKTENGKEALKNAADDIGEEIIGQIFVSLFEFVIKGTIELASFGVQAGITSLSDDEIIVLIKSENGEFSKTATEGFNRWKLSHSDKAVLQKPWGIQIWSLNKYKFAVATTTIDDISLDNNKYIEIELLSNGKIKINKTHKIGLTSRWIRSP